jgi:bla regulator protein BlaR1
MITNYLSGAWNAVAPAIGNHLWQSTLFAVIAGLLTLLLRKNHARARYGLWLAASLKFLIPFSLLVGIGSHVIGSDLGWSHASGQSKAEFYFAMDEFSQPFTQPVWHVVSRTPPTTVPQFSANLMHQLPVILSTIWLVGFAVVICAWCVRWRRMSAAMRSAVPVNEGREVEALRRLESQGGIRRRIEMLLSRASLEPGIFGIARPVLVWPEGISARLDDKHVEAIVAHEVWHVRRRDNLAAAMHMLVEAIFWFHPLVWWMGARLVEEREVACDEEVLELGSERQVYAESILKICEFCVGSQLACVSGVTGADLKKRIVRIMTEQVSRKLDLNKKVLLGAAAGAVLALPVVFGLAHAMPSRGQSSAVETRPQFDVASVKPCDKNSPPPPAAGRGGADGSAATGRMDMPCSTLAHLIEVAYVEFPNGVRLPRLAFKPLPIEGGPAWLKSDTFLISAETETSPTPAPTMMRGPMLQRILEDRFKLKVRRETREVPVYELTVAKGGLKIPHTVPGSCKEEDLVNVGRPPQPGEKPLCVIGRRTNGNNITVWSRGMTLNQICHYLDTMGIDRPVIDKTDVADTEKFDIQLQFSIDETTPGLHPQSVGDAGYQGDPLFPSLFTALQEVGLKLVPARGPGQFMVIDGVEKPSGN